MLCMKESNHDSDFGCALRESIHWGVGDFFPAMNFGWKFIQIKTKQFSNSSFLCDFISGEISMSMFFLAFNI